MVALAENAEGNRLTRTRVSDNYVTAYEWDHRNRLVSVTERDDMETVLAVTEHDYDAFNQWIRRTVDADGPGWGDPASTIFAHHDGQIVYQFDGDEAADLTNRYLWNPAAVDHLLVDEVVANLSTAGDLQFPLGDHLGTIRDIADYNASTDTTTIANHIRYNSFGQVISETNSAIDLLFGFTSRPFDDSTSLQNNLHRWYDAAMGQWVSEDPIGFDGGDFNIRRYVSNHTDTLVDPTGLQPPGTLKPPGGFGPGRIFKFPQKPPVGPIAPPQGTEENGYDGLGEWEFRTKDELYKHLTLMLGSTWNDHRSGKIVWGERVISYGCIGLAQYRLGFYSESAFRDLTAVTGKEQTVFPCHFPGAVLFESEASARKYRDILGQQGVIARIVAWQHDSLAVTKTTREREYEGQIFLDEITHANNNEFNFSTLLSTGGGFEYWEYARAAFNCLSGDIPANMKPDKIYHTQALVKDSSFSNTVVYVVVPLLAPPTKHHPLWPPLPLGQ